MSQAICSYCRSSHPGAGACPQCGSTEFVRVRKPWGKWSRLLLLAIIVLHFFWAFASINSGGWIEFALLGMFLIAIYHFKRWAVYAFAIVRILSILGVGLMMFVVDAETAMFLGGTLIRGIVNTVIIWLIIKPRWADMTPALKGRP